MADKYLVTFDIVNGSTEDYNAIHTAVDRSFKVGGISDYIRIVSLTTTYAIKSNQETAEIRDLFLNATSKKIHVLVVKYIGSAWSLDEKSSDYIKSNF